MQQSAAITTNADQQIRRETGRAIYFVDSFSHGWLVDACACVWVDLECYWVIVFIFIFTVYLFLARCFVYCYFYIFVASVVYLYFVNNGDMVELYTLLLFFIVSKDPFKINIQFYIIRTYSDCCIITIILLYLQTIILNSLFVANQNECT